MSPRFSIRPLSAQPDARLAELAAGGEERAFETLTRRHRRALGRYCAKIGVPEHRVDDVLQQSLTRAWLSLCGGAKVSEPRAWLYRIVHNASINSIRAARRHAHDPLEPLALSTGEDPGLGLRARDALGHIAALPEMQKEAIVLTAIEGRSHQETAGLLGVSDGAVRGLVHRARSTLRSAAAALTPQGLLGLLSRPSGEAPLAERAAEISASGAAAAGATGFLAKGAVVTAVAGLLAAGGSVAHLGVGQGHHHKQRESASAPPVPASTEAASSGHAPSLSGHLLAAASGGRTTGRGQDRRRGGQDHSGDRGSSGRDGGRAVAPLTAGSALVVAGEGHAGEGAGHDGGGRRLGSPGGSDGSGSGGDGASALRASSEPKDPSGELRQPTSGDGSGASGGDGSGSGSLSEGQGDALSGGSGDSSAQAETEADGSGRGG